MEDIIITANTYAIQKKEIYNLMLIQYCIPLRSDTYNFFYQ